MSGGFTVLVPPEVVTEGDSEGWHVVAEANRIFGFDAWDRRTLTARCVWTGMSGKQ